MRFLKPILAGAALVALAIPALASADAYQGYGSYDDHRDGGYVRQFDGGGQRRDQGNEYDRRAYADRGSEYRHDGYSDPGYGGYRYGYAFRHHHSWRMHRRWEDYRGW